MTQPKRTVFTHCHICEQLCALEVTTSGNTILTIEPNKQNPYSWRDFCIKAATSGGVISHPNRILSPMRRIADGRYVKATYDEAIADIASRLKHLVDEDGADCVADYVGNPAALSFNNLQFNNAFFSALGTRSRFYVGSIDQNALLVVARAMYGSPNITLQTDLDLCECLLLVGSNPAISGMNWMGRSPDGWRRIVSRRNAGMDLIIVDPRVTESVKHASLHLAPLPESDWALLLAMLHMILQHGWEDRDACAEVTHFEDFRALVLSADLDELVRRCDVRLELIEAAARRFAQARTAACIARTGTSQGRNGAIAEWLAQALNVVTGRIDQPGGRFLPTFPINLAAHPPRGAKDRQSRIRGLWPVEGAYSLAELPDEILTPGPGRIRSLFINGGNPVVSGPDGVLLDRALSSLDLLVAIDLFQRESHRNAHWLIPGLHFLERSEVHVGLHAMNDRAYVGATRAAVQPPEDVRPEWEFFRDLAIAMGLRLFGRDIAPEPDDLVRRMLGVEPRVTLEEITSAEHGVYRGNQEFGHFRKSLHTPDHRVDICPPGLAQQLRARLKESPQAKSGALQIVSRRSKHMMNSWLAETTARKSRSNRTDSAEMAIADAKRLGLCDGDVVEVASDVGTIVAKLRVSSDIRSGVLVVEHGWGSGLYDPITGTLVSRSGSNRNLLVSGRDLDPLTGVPALNGTWVTVKRANIASVDISEPAGMTG